MSKRGTTQRHWEPSPRQWDITIVVLLSLCAMAIIAANMFPSMWLSALRVVGFIGFILIAYGSFVEPRLLRVRRERIPLQHPATLRIAVASDIHVGPYNGAAFVQRLVAKINALEPDVIVLPGDFVEDAQSNLSDLLPFKELRAPLGVFAVLGNHDTGHSITFGGEHYRIEGRMDEVTAALRAMNIAVLRNEHVIVEHAGRKVAIAGADHVWMQSADLKKTLADVPPAALTILLAHIPDVILDEDSRMADLIICGHTHGGQIRLPIIGPLSPIPDKLGRSFTWGLRKMDNGTYVDISCGAGESGIRARLFCPPEVVMLEVGGG